MHWCTGAQRAIWARLNSAKDLYLAHVRICAWPIFVFEVVPYFYLCPYLCFICPIFLLGLFLYLYLIHICICKLHIFVFVFGPCIRKKKILEGALMVHREQSGPGLILQMICTWPIFESVCGPYLGLNHICVTMWPTFQEEKST